MRSNNPSPLPGLRDLGRSAAAKLSAPPAATPISGGPFEASGVVQVPNSNFLLFVNDSRPGEVFQMEINAAGRQVGAVKAIPLGAEVDNPEAITYGGGYFYVAGSQAEADGRGAQLRSCASPTIRRAGRRAGRSHPRPPLLAPSRGAGFRGEGEKPAHEGGLNVEGLAWDPVNSGCCSGCARLCPTPGLDRPAQIGAPRAGRSPPSNLRSGRARSASPRRPAAFATSSMTAELRAFLDHLGMPDRCPKPTSGSGSGAVSGCLRPGAEDPRKETHPGQAGEARGSGQRHDQRQEFIFIVGDDSKYLKLDYLEKR